MTLKNRNRMIFSLHLLCIASFFLSILIVFFAFSTQSLNFSELYNQNNHALFSFSSQPIFILIGIFIQLLFSIISSYVLYRSFVNTQSCQVLFFALFIFAVLLDAFRLWVFALNLEQTYSPLFLFCGNTSLISSLIIPCSLLTMSIVAYTEQKQDSERFVPIIILTIIFASTLIPLNTTKVHINYSVDFSFRNIIITYSVLCYALTLLINFLYNKQRTYNQKTTIGLLFLMCGVHSIKYSINLYILILAIFLLVFGCILYIKELHNQYLWTD